MFRLLLIILIILLVIVYSIVDVIISILISLFNKESLLKYYEQVAKITFRIITFASGVAINVNGKENLELLDKDKAYMIISNHRSNFDVITGYPVFPGDIGIIAKDNLAGIPFLSYWMKRINCIFLNRNDIRDGFKMILKAIENINTGISMWIFPEGTRCKSERKTDILEFKAGVFKIPEKTDCYILPVAFINTEEVFEKHKPFIKSAKIYINIGKPYKMSLLSNEERQDIASYSEKVIKDLLEEGVKKWQIL